MDKIIVCDDILSTLDDLSIDEVIKYFREIKKKYKECTSLRLNLDYYDTDTLLYLEGKRPMTPQEEQETIEQVKKWMKKSCKN